MNGRRGNQRGNPQFRAKQRCPPFIRCPLPDPCLGAISPHRPSRARTPRGRIDQPARWREAVRRAVAALHWTCHRVGVLFSRGAFFSYPSRFSEINYSRAQTISFMDGQRCARIRGSWRAIVGQEGLNEAKAACSCQKAAARTRSLAKGTWSDGAVRFGTGDAGDIG